MTEIKNILVVDDDPEILRMVTTYLTGEGYSVETASNGARMGEIMEAHAIDLVILDLGLPGHRSREPSGVDPASMSTRSPCQRSVQVFPSVSMLKGSSFSPDAPGRISARFASSASGNTLEKKASGATSLASSSRRVRRSTDIPLEWYAAVER